MGWLSPDMLKVGAGGLLTLFVFALILGYLIPKWVALRMNATAEANSAMWKQIAETERARADLATKQSGEMIAGFETLANLVRSSLASSKETR